MEDRGSWNPWVPTLSIGRLVGRQGVGPIDKTQFSDRPFSHEWWTSISVRPPHFARFPPPRDRPNLPSCPRPPPNYHPPALPTCLRLRQALTHSLLNEPRRALSQVVIPLGDIDRGMVHPLEWVSVSSLNLSK